jgi:hypothetical protein
VSYINGSFLLWLQRLAFLSGVRVFRLRSLWVVREHLYGSRPAHVHIGRGQSTADEKNLPGLNVHCRIFTSLLNCKLVECYKCFRELLVPLLRVKMKMRIPH